MIYDSSDDTYAQRMLHAKLTRIDRLSTRRISWARLIGLILILGELWLFVGMRRMAVVTALAMGSVIVFAGARKWRRRG